MLFKYRYNPDFKKKVMSGKVFICEKHFEASDIHISSKKSWIKHSCVPTLNFPSKPIESVPPKKRRVMVRDASSSEDSDSCLPIASSSKDSDSCLPRNELLPDQMPASRSLPLHLSDIASEFQASSISNWRLHMESKKIHFTYYKDLTVNSHAVPSVSLLITEDENEGLEFSCAINGFNCHEISSFVYVRDSWNLQHTLEFLTRLKICKGYETVTDSNE